MPMLFSRTMDLTSDSNIHFLRSQINCIFDILWDVFQHIQQPYKLKSPLQNKTNPSHKGRILRSSFHVKADEILQC